MKQSAYIQILHYLRVQNKPVHPKELSTTLDKSRVTIQSSLKRLMKNGWVQKIGASPKTAYQALELSLVPHETQQKDKKALSVIESSQKMGLLEQFIYNSNRVRFTTDNKLSQ